MPIVLYRVDERLIHGQVVIGWGSQLRPSTYVVVDDELAESEWEQELYRLGLPEGTESEFVTVSEARLRMPDWREASVRTVLLTRDVGTMVRLARDGVLEGEDVNLGGIHHSPGREEILRYIHLDAGDRRDLRRLQEEGVRVTARDLPGTPRVGLKALLG